MMSALDLSLQAALRRFLAGDTLGAQADIDASAAPEAQRALLRARLLRDRGQHEASIVQAERALALAEGQAARARALVELGSSLIGTGRHAEAEAALREGRDLARAQDDVATLGEAHHRLARLAYMRGDTAEGLRQLAHALRWLEQAGEEDGRAEALFHRAAHRGRQGDVDAADADATEALAIFVAQGNRRGQMRALQVLGGLALPRQDFDRAEAQLSEARQMAESMGERFAAAVCTLNLAEVHRLEGRLEHARDLYEQTLAVFDAGSRGYSVIVRFNLALVDLGLKEFAAAEARLRALEGTDAAMHGQGAFFHVPLMACAAVRGDLAAWDHHDHHARMRIEEHRIVEADLAWAGRLTAEILEGSGGAPQLSRAARARELTLTQLEALNRPTDAEAERAALRRLAERGAPVPLGPFDLTRRIGAGGMAEVWEGAHRATGERVAVKVLTEDRAREPAQRADFAREVRAIAALEHPHIARVVGHGVVGAAAEVMTEGRLVRGSPYLAMELAAGTLRPWCGRLSWSVVQGILLDLLAALAHAHARGVVHRDLKPDNVLLLHPERPDLPPPVRLADFGLARLGHGDADQGRIMGTPAYMAPEQLRGQAQDQGPWTDLYALGAMAWRLVTGRRVFEVEDLHDLRHAHLFETPPPLRAHVAVPPELEGWLRRLLAKSPWDRFRSAADAAWALRKLGDAKEPRLHDLVEEPFTEETFDLGSVVTPSHEGQASTQTLRIGPVAPTLQLDGAAPAARPSRALFSISEPPPLPQRPRSRAAPQDSPVTAVHLGLHGLRRLPMVDREDEQARLWEALRRKRPAAVVLRGAAGVGKTRLAEGFAERAEEEGGAVVLRAAHGPADADGCGVIPAIARWLRCEGVDEQALWSRLTQRLRPRAHPDLVHKLRALLAHPESVPEPTLRRTLTELLSLLARHRPVLLLLEDAQWGAESLERARHLLERGAPILVVACVREQAHPPRADAALAALLAHPHAEEMPIDALPDEASCVLVRELVGGAGPLADLVVEGAAGNPLYAVQLVDDWLRRGLLLPSLHGLRLRAGAEPKLPSDLPALWAKRLESLLQGLAVAEREALELAALLGPRVPEGAWRTALAQLGNAAGAQALERLLQARLAITEADGSWSFTHSQLQEALTQAAQARGELERLHAACVAPASRPAQRGHHLLLSGQLDAAAEALLRATERALERGDPAGAGRLVARAEAALAQRGGGPGEAAAQQVSALKQRLTHGPDARRRSPLQRA